MSQRDPDLERALLTRLAHVADRRFGLDCRPYIRRVEVRLRFGAKRYGDDLHDGRDLIGELLEEPPDVGAWSLLELQRLGGDATPAVRNDLLSTALCGALADFYARRAARTLRQEGRRG